MQFVKRFASICTVLVMQQLKAKGMCRNSFYSRHVSCSNIINEWEEKVCIL